MRRLKEMQEEDRRKKLEELKQHVSQRELSEKLQAIIDSVSGPSRSEVPGAAGPGEEATHRTAPDEGYGQEATGGGAEEGDREVRA